MECARFDHFRQSRYCRSRTFTIRSHRDTDHHPGILLLDSLDHRRFHRTRPTDPSVALAREGVSGSPRLDHRNCVLFSGLAVCGVFVVYNIVVMGDEHYLQKKKAKRLAKEEAEKKHRMWLGGGDFQHAIYAKERLFHKSTRLNLPELAVHATLAL